MLQLRPQEIMIENILKAFILITINTPYTQCTTYYLARSPFSLHVSLEISSGTSVGLRNDDVSGASLTRSLESSFLQLPDLTELDFAD